MGTSIDAKINARALGKSDPDIVAPTPTPVADSGPQLPTWTNRPILHPDHVTDLEQAAAVNEFGRKLPRSKAEAEAYDDYVKRHRVEAAAHHLAGSKAADAAGDKEAARKHYVMYQLHSKALGHDAVGAAHPDVVALTEAAPPRVYRFKAHKADAFALAQGGDEGGSHENLGKAEGMDKGNETKTPLPELHKALHELWRGLKVLSKADDDKAMKARDRSAKASKTTCPECGEMKAYWAQTCPGCHRKKYAMGKGEVKATATKSVCRCPGYKFPHRHGGGACREKK